MDRVGGRSIFIEVRKEILGRNFSKNDLEKSTGADIESINEHFILLHDLDFCGSRLRRPPDFIAFRGR